MRPLAFCLALILTVFGGHSSLMAEDLVIASPGSPKAGDEAHRIAAALATELLAGGPTGRYESEHEACEKALATRPKLALLSLPYFLEKVQGGEAWKPLLVPVLKGRSERAYVLLRRSEAPPLAIEALPELETELAWAQSFVQKVLLEGKSPPIKPVKRLLRSLKGCLTGHPEALLVDEDQWQAAQAIPSLAKGLTVIYKTRPLPAAVLAIAPSAAADEAFSKSVQERGLKLADRATREPRAKDLLETLGFDGFAAPPSEKLKELSKIIDGASQKPMSPKKSESEGRE